MPALVARDLRRTYGETVALDGVSLDVEAGEVFALVGPNGAGKTTLVRALTGTTDAEGTVEVFGSPPESVERSRLGLLPQEFDPPGRLTARELLAYYRGLYDEGRAVDAVLDDVGLRESADTRYEHLSGGQRRRACVGTALVNGPDLLVLDEPTTGIDPAGRRTVWRLLEDLAAAGATVLLTTHYMAEAERLADRVGLLADGRLVDVGSPRELVETHGGESRVVVEFAPDDPLPDAAVERLERDGFATVADPDARTVVVEDVEPRAIGRVVEALEATGAVYEGVEWTRPDLETVYLRLTGTAPGSSERGTPVDDAPGGPATADSVGASADPPETGGGRR